MSNSSTHTSKRADLGNSQTDRDQDFHVSVVVTTYNRSEFLLRAFQCLLEQRTNGVKYEVIAVDNNSTDDTRKIIESLIDSGHSNLRYCFEPRQGFPTVVTQHRDCESPLTLGQMMT